MTAVAVGSPTARVGLEPAAAATFAVVAVAFSRVSESIETSSRILPLSSLLAAGAVGVVLLSRSERDVPRPMVPLTAILACTYLAVAVFSSIGARDIGRSLEAIDGLLRSMVIALGVVVLVTSPRRLDLALSGVVWATLVVAGVSCLQVATGSYESTYLGLARSELGAIDTEAGWRLGGPLGDPNFFAQVLAVGVVVSLARLIAARGAGRSIVVPLAATLTGTTALLLTYSRGGLLAFAAALFVLSLRWLSWRALAAAAVLALALVVTAPDALIGRLGTAAEATPKALSGQPVEDSAINGRASEAIVGYQQFGDNVLLGVGIGNYQAHYLDYAGALGLEMRGEGRSAHSLVVETLAEMGIVGLGALTVIAGFVFAAVGSLRGQWAPGEARDDLWWCAVAVEAALVAHFLCALFLHSAYPRGQWLLLGLALACGQVRRTTAHDAELVS